MPPQNFKLPLLIISLTALIVGSAWYYQHKMNEVALSEAVHVHSDLSVYLNDERLRFTDPKYQSGAEHVLHADFHFHDGNDEVIHRHADSLTLSDFFASLGFLLTNDCFVTDSGAQYCSGSEASLKLFVNGEEKTDLIGYVPADEDRILLYFGSVDSPDLQSYIDSVSDRACIYSYTCPLRGTPPPEECGLTCEL